MKFEICLYHGFIGVALFLTVLIVIQNLEIGYKDSIKDWRVTEWLKYRFQAMRL